MVTAIVLVIYFLGMIVIAWIDYYNTKNRENYSIFKRVDDRDSIAPWMLFWPIVLPILISVSIIATTLACILYILQFFLPGKNKSFKAWVTWNV